MTQQQYTETRNFIAGPARLADFGPDLWLQARQQTLSSSPKPTLGQRLLKLVSDITRRTLVARADQTVVVDLSSYQPNCNVEALIDQGVRVFILRTLYIARYVYDQWGLTEDPTYRTYFNRIRAYAAKKGVQCWIGGYVLYTAGVEDQDYTNSHVYTDAIGLATSGGYLPDFWAIDDEVNKWYQSGNTVYATPVNQVRGCTELRRKMWAKWGRMVMHYSGRWFINQTAGGGSYLDQYTTAFDQLNKPASLGGVGVQFPGWYAWYPQTFTQTFTAIMDVLNLLITPSGQQVASLLSIGSYTQAILWQFTGALITNANTNAAGQPSGVDASITMGTLPDFLTALNLTYSTGSDSGSTGGSTGGSTAGSGGSVPPTGDMATVIAMLDQIQASITMVDQKIDQVQAGQADLTKTVDEIRSHFNPPPTT